MIIINLVNLLFFGIPLASIVYFVVNLCLFISAWKKNKLSPNSIDPQIMRLRKIKLIISTVIVVVLIAVVIGFIIFLHNAVKHM